MRRERPKFREQRSYALHSSTAFLPLFSDATPPPAAAVMQRRLDVCRTHGDSFCRCCWGTQPPPTPPKQAAELDQQEAELHPPQCAQLRLLLGAAAVDAGSEWRDCRNCSDVVAVDLNLTGGGAVQATTPWSPLGLSREREHGSAKAAAVAAVRFMPRVWVGEREKNVCEFCFLQQDKEACWLRMRRTRRCCYCRCPLPSAVCCPIAGRSMMRRQALTGGGRIFSLGVAWSQALCAKVSLFVWIPMLCSSLGVSVAANLYVPVPRTLCHIVVLSPYCMCVPLSLAPGQHQFQSTTSLLTLHTALGYMQLE